MSFKVFVAILSIILTLSGYSFYFRDIFAGKTKPHAYSWLVWALLTAIAFAGQLSAGGGPGTWVTGLTSAISFIIFGLAIQRGEKQIALSDKLNLAGAGVALLLWALTSNPLTSIILITIVDFLGFIPTIRKSYSKPGEETLIHYVFAGLKFILAIIALDHYSLTTWLYPASLVAGNLFFVPMLVIRRRQLGVRAAVAKS
jgi:fucose 4-O-acetylase-like acetyltransferase